MRVTLGLVFESKKQAPRLLRIFISTFPDYGRVHSLIRAATEYETSRGFKFILHAACRILQKIKQTLTNQ